MHRKPIATDAPSQPPLSLLPLPPAPRPSPHTPFDPLRIRVLAGGLLASLCVPPVEPLPRGLLSEEAEASGLWTSRHGLRHQCCGERLGATRERLGPRDLTVFGVLGMAASGCLGFGARTVRWGCVPGGQATSCALGQMCFLLCIPGSEANARYCEGETRRGPGLRS